MNLHHQSISVFAVTAAAIGLLLLFAPPTSSQAGSEKAFGARLRLMQTGPPEADPRCPAPTVLVSLVGSGVASRLGRVSAVASHCIEDDPASIPFTAGLLVMSNPRGDLFIEYSGTDTAGDLEGTFVITGGTGRYAGAAGGGTLSGRGSPEEERGSIRLEGTVTIPTTTEVGGSRGRIQPGLKLNSGLTPTLEHSPKATTVATFTGGRALTTAGRTTAGLIRVQR
jgi:hypothetical protein